MYVLFYLSRLPACSSMSSLASSVAIWNKNRVVVGISFGIWVINIAFLIQGEPKNFSFCRPVDRESYNNLRSQASLGYESIQRFVISGIDIIFSSALHGQSEQCALYLTSRVSNLISSPPSLPTSRYCSSCSLACSAFAVMEPALLVWDGCCGSR